VIDPLLMRVYLRSNTALRRTSRAARRTDAALSSRQAWAARGERTSSRSIRL
jgi:hypothetical protein